MDPNMWANGASFEELLKIWSPPAMDYHSDNLGFLTHEEITTLPAACFTNPQLPINIVGGESSQDIVQFYQEVASFGDLGYTSLSRPQSSGSWMDIGNMSQGSTHPIVVGSSSSSSRVPQRHESDISYPRVEYRTYNKFSHQDVEKLIQGVEKYKRRWKSIKLYYFNDSVRTKDQLKEKWRHMLKSADTQTNPILKELYLKAKNVDATLPKK